MCRAQYRVVITTRLMRSYTGVMESGCCPRPSATNPSPKANSFGCWRSELPRRFRFRRLAESEVSALATECLLRGAGNLEQSALDQGLTHPASEPQRLAVPRIRALVSAKKRRTAMRLDGEADYRCIPVPGTGLCRPERACEGGTGQEG